ncbi:MAG: hypothetical protein ACQR33_04465 [Candidatus Saccharibacteria bacterium]
MQILGLLFLLSISLEAFGAGGKQRNWTIIRSFKPLQVVAAALVVAATIFTAWLLVGHVSFLDRNPLVWLGWKAFGWGNGKVNASFLLGGLPRGWFMLAFLPVALFAQPTTAIHEQLRKHGLPEHKKNEKGKKVLVDNTKHLASSTPVEKQYDWRNAVRNVLGYGVFFLIWLLPLGVVLALMAICGGWITYQYSRGGLRASVPYGALVNMGLITYIFIAFLL